MEHRHLLPDEVDLLVDGEEGFGVAPLAAHVERCSQCRAAVEKQRHLVVSLERLPHLTPSPLFAYHVMREVHVFEPWHVAALDSVRRFVPRSQPAKVLAMATASVVAVTMSLATLWIGTRLDAVAFLANVVSERLRIGATGMAGSLVASTVGDGAAAAFRGSGVVGIAVLLTAFMLTVLVAAFGLRAVTSTRRRRA